MTTEARAPTPDKPLVYLFERDDGSQILVHIYAFNDVELAERPNNSDVWGVPITGEQR